jgi:pyruvate dehydrogenase E2 component (dihydrolipoyllysine-residue acetyltransferase)
MLSRVLGLVAAMYVFAVAPALAQAPAPAPAAPSAPPQGEAPARSGGGGQKVGQTGNPDPGVTFLNVVENPHVRVLQVTLQPGAIRRPHVHNDVTFHMLVPVTGSLELTIEKEAPITTVPGQAYYMVKGQTHSFTNKTGAAVQVIELFIKPDPATAAAAPAAAPTAPAPAGTTTPAPPAAPMPAPSTPPTK